MLRLLLVLWRSRDRQQVDRVAGIGLAQHFPLEAILRHRVILQLKQVPLQISERIRVTVREVDSVKVVIELACPGQSIVSTGALLRDAVLVVADVAADPVPSLSRLRIFARVHQRLHSMVVKTVRLEKVDNVEAVEAAGPRVPQAEVIPLAVALGQVVWL